MIYMRHLLYHSNVVSIAGDSYRLKDLTKQEGEVS